jgi:hypothetical protein
MILPGAGRDGRTIYRMPRKSLGIFRRLYYAY